MLIALNEKRLEAAVHGREKQDITMKGAFLNCCHVTHGVVSPIHLSFSPLLQNAVYISVICIALTHTVALCLPNLKYHYFTVTMRRHVLLHQSKWCCGLLQAPTNTGHNGPKTSLSFKRSVCMWGLWPHLVTVSLESFKFYSWCSVTITHT